MTAPARSTRGTPGAVWTAAAVARRLGVAPGTLRSWSRRYGIGPAAHTPGRHRRYTDTDVAELDTMCDLVAQGMVLSAAAEVAHSRRAPDTSPPSWCSSTPGAGAPLQPGWQPADAVPMLVAAGASLDSDAAADIVATCMDAHGVVNTWEGLCRPALRDLATAADLACTGAQLLLSWAIGNCLRRAPTTPCASDATPVLLVCAPEEHHTLGLEVLFGALVEHRIPSRMLGAAVPDSALRQAVQQLRPAVVVVWAQRPLAATTDVLCGLIPHPGTVLAAGPGWRRTTLPDGVTWTNDLRDALGLMPSCPESTAR